MGRVLVIIGGMLVVLVIVAFSVTIHESDVRDEKKAEAAMFHLAPVQIDRIVIDGPDGAKAQLVRTEGRWILPSLNGFPADAEKVETLLHRLLAIDREQPADSSENALEDLKLADHNFERRITLVRNGKELAAVLVGKARGPRHVYLRRADEDVAYTAVFGLFDALPEAVDWIDRGILKMAPDDIAAIEVSGLRMTADPAAGWRLSDDTAEGELNAAAAAHLAALLAGLEIETLEAPAAPADSGSPELSLTLTTRGGAAIDYGLYRSATTNDFTLRVSSRPETFRLSTYSAHQLLNAARREALLGPAGGASHHAASGAASGTAPPAHN